MKRPGLTESMRRALEQFSIGRYDTDATFRRAFSAGLCDRNANLTPRGQAALAAPRVTAAELAMLELLAANGNPWSAGKQHVVADMLNRLEERGWVSDTGWHYYLNDAGTTALNNVRAASGSEEWKP